MIELTQLCFRTVGLTDSFRCGLNLSNFAVIYKLVVFQSLVFCICQEKLSRKWVLQRLNSLSMLLAASVKRAWKQLVVRRI